MFYLPFIEWVNKMLDKFIAGIKEEFATFGSTLGTFMGTVVGLAAVWFAYFELEGWRGQLFLLAVMCFSLWAYRQLKRGKGEK